MPVPKHTWRSELRKLIEQKWAVGETFSSDDVYEFERHFQQLYPSNHHVRNKLQQMMQQVRDEGLVEFIDNDGSYRRIS
jgi:hypothetical protein